MVAEQALHFGRVLVFLDVCHAGNVAGIGGGNEPGRDGTKSVGRTGWRICSHAGQSRQEVALESANFGRRSMARQLLRNIRPLKRRRPPGPAGRTSITFFGTWPFTLVDVNEFTAASQTPGLHRYRRRHGAGK